MSLLELQKFLLEYQRVSSTLAQGREDGVGSGIGMDLVFQGVSLPWSWGDLVVWCSAWHGHNLSSPFLEQEVMRGKCW